MTGSPPLGSFACDAGALQELLAGKTLACPCCNGPLTADKLARLLSDVQRLAAAASDQPRYASNGVGRHAGMIIDSHAHMISRTTDDYEAMAKAGVVAVIEPAFWLGQPRTNVGSYVDYFAMISGFERFRAGQFGIRHYCTIGLNPKEANNEALAEAVIDALPRFLVKEGVVAMGELGYDEQTPLEDKALRKQIELAKEYLLPIMIHTPHRDKRAGTLRTMDVLKEHKFDPARCVIDHNNEETIRDVLNRGYWCAFSIYPQTKMGSERMAALVESFGPDRLIVDSACDWGVSDPLAVAKTARLMAQRGVIADAIHQVIYSNALAVYGLNGEMDEQHWLAPAAIDQRTLYEAIRFYAAARRRASSSQAVQRTSCGFSDPKSWRLHLGRSLRRWAASYRVPAVELMLNCLYVGPPVIHYTPTNCPQVYGHNTIKSGVTVENCATSPHLKTARRRGCVFNFKLNFQKELVLDCASTLSYTSKSSLCWLGGESISSRPKCSPTARFADLFCFLNATRHTGPIDDAYHHP